MCVPWCSHIRVSGVVSLRRVGRFLLLAEFRACSLARLVPALQAGPRCLQVLQEKPALPSGAAGETSAVQLTSLLVY